MARNHDLADVDCLYRFKTKNGKSIAIAKEESDIPNTPIFLPVDEIEVYRTGRFEAGLEIVTVTMPQWLAEDRDLV